MEKIEFESFIILRCYNCGNQTKHELINYHVSNILFDQFVYENETENLNQDFYYLNYQCSTCSGMNIIGGFKYEVDTKNNRFKRLYPIGPNIRLPDHQLIEHKQPVPLKILNIYEEIWFLRMQVPNAFANQIRRCLEMICNEKGALGKTLKDKLNDLKAKGYLPGTNEDLVNLIREVGNIGSHHSGHDLDIWDVELLDEFFKIVVDYIYITPKKIERLNERLEVKK